MKKCIMQDRACSNCGECLKCDLDPGKICDNCCKCLGDADYSGIEIDDILVNTETLAKKARSED